MTQQAASQVPGAPCWFELATSDQNAANSFYSEMFGWSIRNAPIGDGMVYSIYMRDGRDVGGGYTLLPDMRQQGIPPHWAVYFATSDADQTVARVTELGGSVIDKPFDVADQGRMAVCRDPEGAVFCLWQSKKHAGATSIGDVHTICWSELASWNIQEASGFYSKLFGWETKNSDNMPYIEFATGSEPRGGLLQMDDAMKGVPPHWRVYIRVTDCDAAVAKINSLGGETKFAPFDAPNVGRMAVVTDPQGALFAVIQLNS